MINNLSFILEGLKQATKEDSVNLASIKSELTQGGNQLILYIDYTTKEYMLTHDKYNYVYLDSRCINIAITKTMKTVNYYAEQLKQEGYKHVTDKWEELK
ncbi:TPA: hypothetical protein QFM61_001096 [Enterococcus faecium]